MEEVFHLKNTELDKHNCSKSNKVKFLNEFIYRHKFFYIVLVSLIVLSIINFSLIYSFFKILERI